jgi:hypothetical protein
VRVEMCLNVFIFNLRKGWYLMLECDYRIAIDLFRDVDIFLDVN